MQSPPSREHGSAKWGKAKPINARYRSKQPEQNKILTQQVRIGLDDRKPRFYAKPNVMQAHTSFVVLDPKGEILRDTGHLLKSKDYDIKVLDLINPHRSHGYNPFAYLQDDKDVLKLVTNLIRNTTPKGRNTNDPF
ncbi:type IV secretory system conjugative DNA transfer family protein [Paenibacillus donghaensis]|uniref:type IV secretory system conjugative DNA transfer family protein n=1 Tax=Paenibacillus donghaensis TaxID=414771 RepID=UPI001D16C8BD|nr:type IV secretory system conjugative DNA transfer family protein [Paenibacillus donghaensis]